MGKGRRTRQERRTDAQSSRRLLLARAKGLLRRIRTAIAGLGRWERWGVTVFVLLVSAVAYLVVTKIPGSQPVEFDLKADQGKTSFRLATEFNAVSPGCGCPAPEYGKHPWEGMSVPSVGFDLSVNSKPSDEVVDHLWSLTAISPETGTINWFGEQDHSLWMRVTAIHSNGSQSVLFKGAASHFVLWTDKVVRVSQPSANPYMAMLPSADGKTSFSTHEASRNAWGAKVDISSEAPATPELDPSKGCTDPKVGQRGPMVDVLGPTLRFSVPDTTHLEMWAAQKQVAKARPGDRIRASITTPFALRLIANPVQRKWESALEDSWHGKMQRALASDRVGNLVSRGPYAQNRVLLRESLPAYTVRIRHLQTPRRATWVSFAKRSSRQEVIPAMMGMTSLDRDKTWEEHALPPVSLKPQIGVFGRITEFDSTSVGGHAVIASKSRPIARGQELRFVSDKGLGAGAYRFTPLVSSGQETARASVFGTATVWIGGSVASHPNWFPWVPFGALASAVIGFFVAKALGWNRGRDESQTGKQS